MQELAKAIYANSKVYDETLVEPEVKPDLLGPERELQEAAKKWAAVSLDTFSGDTLRKAMAISLAIADFTESVRPPS